MMPDKEQKQPQQIPEKFLDKQGGVDIERLLKSYQALEQKLGQQGQGLGNVPDSPDGYEIDLSHGLFDLDGDLNAKMYERGFSPEQAQLVYDMAAEKLIPLVQEIAQEFRADKELERLKNEFGGEEKFSEVARQLAAFGKKEFPEEALQALASSYEGVMALYSMMQSAEPSPIKDKSEESSFSGDERLKQMVRDPRYWRDRDPAYVAQVTQAFQRFYNS